MHAVWLEAGRCADALRDAGDDIRREVGPARQAEGPRRERFGDRERRARAKIPEAVEFESDLIVNIEDRLGYMLLPLEPESMMRAARFEDSHADPFDRMIAAQAIQNNLPILSADAKLEAFGVRRLKAPKR